MIEDQTLALTQQNLAGIGDRQIAAVLKLMDEGNTVPFIARYRKEMTGNLDEVQIQAVEEEYARALALQNRKAAVIKSITEQHELTPKLRRQIETSATLQDVEDLYLPYKQKRQTKATIAKQRGLAPFARWILTFPQGNLTAEARQYVDPAKQVATIQDVLDGAHEILAESFSEVPALRNWVRGFTTRTGQVTAQVKPHGKQLDDKGVFQQYYAFVLPVKKLAPTQILAINRGEKEKILLVKVQVDTDAIMRYCHFKFIGEHAASPATAFIESAYADAYKRFVGPAIEREVRNDLTATAAAQSIKVFGQNLYNLLMQAPIKGKIVLGFDPAYRTGCKLAVVDENGKFLDKAVIYPHKPASEQKRQAAMPAFIGLLEKYHVQMIAIGNGTASRESEQFVAAALKQIKRQIYYVIVSEAGASVYSASALARSEFPDLPVEQRSAISIARRLQDPLAELVKIDPQAIGVGQYQHDLPVKDLTKEVDAVVERAVNRVGVNLNTASYELLQRISGLSATCARNVVEYRNEHGRYDSRTELKKVPRLGPKAYEQSVGFLRIIGGKQPLDNTDIHPESYPLAKQIMRAAGLNADQLGTAQAAAKLKQLRPQDFVRASAGSATVADVISSLQNPGRDERDTMPAPLLRRDVLTMADLKPGMKLEGTVRNVVDFGAFVDIGVKHDGLVHVSKMAREFVRDPKKIVKVGDVVTVWIDAVDTQRERIQLTMVDPQAPA